MINWRWTIDCAYKFNRSDFKLLQWPGCIVSTVRLIVVGQNVKPLFRGLSFIIALTLACADAVYSDEGTNPYRGTNSYKGTNPYISNKTWPHYNGNPANSHYSSLNHINRENVHQLKKAWEFKTGDGEGLSLQFNPMMIGGVLYVGRAEGGLAAVDAASGKSLWQFVPAEDNPCGSGRGAAYWQAVDVSESSRLLYTCGRYLYAVDTRSGHRVSGFGENGRIDMSVAVTSPGVIYRDLVILGSSGGARGDGQVRAYDVRSGALRWSFYTIPAAGEPGFDTWGELGSKHAFGANSWAGMALDQQRGVVYLSTAQPKSENRGASFYNGDWPGRNRFANSVIALQAATGKLLWDFQEIYHDIWDLDLPAPPNLVQVNYQGSTIDAVAQVTKSGNTLLLNRDTGELLYPTQERAAPASRVKEETAYPTQRVFTLPEPFAKPFFTEHDITDLSPEAHQYSRARFNKLISGWFEPPTLTGNIMFGAYGGAEWGGAAFDPTTHRLYVSSNHYPLTIKLKINNGDITPKTGHLPFAHDASLENLDKGKLLYKKTCAACHGADRRGLSAPSLASISKKYISEDIEVIIADGLTSMPALGGVLTKPERQSIARFLLHNSQSQEDNTYSPAYVLPSPVVEPFLDQEGYPGSKPPWATLNAIDLDTGKIIWRVPLGEYAELTERGVPLTGRRHFGGSVVTAGGLVFIAATGDKKIRAFDKNTGKTTLCRFCYSHNVSGEWSAIYCYCRWRWQS